MLQLTPRWRIRLYGALLSVGGLALAVVSCAWDVIKGDSIPHFSGKQLTGLMLGVAMLAAGSWMLVAERPLDRLPSLPRDLDVSTWQWAGAFGLALPASFLAFVLPRTQLYAAANWLFWMYVAAACFLLPRRLGRLCFVMSVSVGGFLTVVSMIKVSLTGLPLTILDLKIALKDPAGLWNALHLAPWTRYAALVAASLAALVLAYSAGHVIFRIMGPGSTRHDRFRAARRIGGIAMIVLAAAGYFDRLFGELGSFGETWDIKGVKALAAEVGVLPYLAYSEHVERTRTGDFFRTSAGGQPPGRDEIRESVIRHLDIGGASSYPSRLLPNIVIVLAESTFDPDSAFRLTAPVRSELFGVGADTVASGLLRVNVVGGGTWVTEFETITGLDSRLFGYAGFYAHAAIAPYVSRSLATYLKAKGYRTTAFFPHDGDFYNYRRAYVSYGFDEIWDSRDLGHGSGWRLTDRQVAADFERTMGALPNSPFFSYVLLVENHGPHKCSVRRVDDMPVRFAGTDAFDANCPLQEYLRRLRSTEAAVGSMLRYLRGLERVDGRPYVLLVFGDHQPFSFTDNGNVAYDFNRLRTAAPLNWTFFHVHSSAGTRIKCCSADVPATLLPTLVSAFAASGPDDVYLGLNLWLYDRCGSDAIGGRPYTDLTFSPSDPSAHVDAVETVTGARRAGCLQAYGRALQGYRDAGIVRFRAGP